MCRPRSLRRIPSGCLGFPESGPPAVQSTGQFQAWGRGSPVGKGRGSGRGRATAQLQPLPLGDMAGHAGPGPARLLSGHGMKVHPFKVKPQEEPATEPQAEPELRLQGWQPEEATPEGGPGPSWERPSSSKVAASEPSSRNGSRRPVKAEQPRGPQGLVSLCATCTLTASRHC